MSMISGQCDRLRELAIRANELHEYEMERELDQAADTIWELRCKLAGMVDMRERARLAEVENDKLREQLAKARDPQRIGGQADPSSFVYAIEQLREFRWQHATNDEDAIPYINNVAAAHERESEKLRELAERAWKAAEMLCQAWDGPCRADGVSTMKPCPMNELDELCVYGLIQLDLREVGVEVGE